MATYIISAILLIIVGFVVSYLIRQRKRNKRCGSGCAGCPYSGRCRH